MAGSGSAGGGHGRRSLFAVDTGSTSAAAREMAGTFWSIAGTAVAMGETFGPGPIATTSSANAPQNDTLTMAMEPARLGRRSGCMALLESPASQRPDTRQP